MMGDALQPPSFTLSLLKIPVTEIENSVRFYRDSLGLGEQFVVADYGWAQLVAGELLLALYKPGMGGGDGRIGGSVGFHLALPHDQFDALASRLQEQAHLVKDEIHQGDDGNTFIDVRDPDGNILKIIRQPED